MDKSAYTSKFAPGRYAGDRGANYRNKKKKKRKKLLKASGSKSARHAGGFSSSSTINHEIAKPIKDQMEPTNKQSSRERPLLVTHLSSSCERRLPLPAEIPQDTRSYGHQLATAESTGVSQIRDGMIDEQASSSSKLESRLLQSRHSSVSNNDADNNSTNNNINNNYNDGSELDTDDDPDCDRLPSVMLDQISKQSLDHMKQVGLFDELRMILVNKLEKSEEFHELTDLFCKEVETFCKRTDMSQPRAKLRDQLNERSLNKTFSNLRFQVNKMIRQHKNRICKQYEPEAGRFFDEMQITKDVSSEKPPLGGRMSIDTGCYTAGSNELLDPSPASSSRSLDSGLALSSSPSSTPPPPPLVSSSQQHKVMSPPAINNRRQLHQPQQQTLVALPVDQIPMPPSPSP